MKDWNYRFESVSKLSWLKQIEKDLKGRSIESLQSVWWDDEIIFPLHHADDLQSENVILPDQFFFSPPGITEWVHTSDRKNESIHQHVFNALTYGSQSIIFDWDGISAPAWDKWLRGVFSEMINVSLQPSQNALDSLASLSMDASHKIFLRLQRGNETSVTFIDSILELSHRHQGLLFIYKIPDDGNWLDGIVRVFRTIQNDLDQWNEKRQDKKGFLENVVLQFEPDKIYFKQIIQTRTLQLIWLNFQKDEKKTKSSPIEIHILNRHDDHPDQFLIQASASSLAASLTGVASLCIHHHSSADYPGFYKRVNRNIHHLLELECNMYRGRDPLAGAYTIDFYTKKWTAKVLQQLLK